MLKVIYATDGIQTEFPFPYRIFNNENLTVFLDEVQVINGFNVENEESVNGASVVFDIAPESGKELTLMRQMQIKRKTDFQPQNPLDLTVLNLELDYQIETLKDLSGKIEKGLMQDLVSNQTLDLILPVPEAGKALLWSETENSLINSEINVNQSITHLKNNIAEMEALNNDIQTYLMLSGDAGVLGIVNNMIGLIASYHSDAFEDYGLVSNNPDENPAYGMIVDPADENIDNN